MTNKPDSNKIKELVEKIQGGDSDSKEEFAALLLPHLTGLANRYYTNLDDASSAASWVITKLINKSHSFDLSKSPMPYINRTMSNYCIDEYRARRRKESKKEAYYPDTDSTSLEHSINFILQDGIEGEELEVLEKYYVDNMSVEQISEQTGKPLNDTKNILSYSQELLEENITRNY